ncbi:MAG: Chondroitin polymerase [Bacteroidota bacterium]|jgi:glycosyltransferase involved in cell wall biosynthesis
MRISIGLATYNGEKFVLEQINSVLNQLGTEDEVIIVDDCSCDHTVELIRGLQDSRIKLILNEHNLGHVKSFDKAISLANNQIIFLCDQDDIWLPGRVKLMYEKLSASDSLLLTSNSIFIDANGKPLEYYIDGVSSSNSSRYFHNILDIFKGKTNYFGCAMVIDHRLKKIILPFPFYVESHDLWIAMAANLLRSNSHIDQATFQRRIHSNNASVIERNIFRRIFSRVLFFISLVHLIIRIKITK